MTTWIDDGERVKFHAIWIEQCEAARDIKIRFGVQQAFDYVVDEKLMSYVDAATTHRAFARELPRFVSAVRDLFTQDEMAAHMARLERQNTALAAEAAEAGGDAAPGDDGCDLWPEKGPSSAQKRAREFAMIRDLLTAPTLGTS